MEGRLKAIEEREQGRMRTVEEEENKDIEEGKGKGKTERGRERLEKGVREEVSVTGRGTEKPQK